MASVLAAIALSAATLSMPATAAYPEAPIRLIVPFGAGGITDIIARHLGKTLANVLDQSVVVENRPGAGGTIGAMALANATPDGYTVFMGTVGTQVVNPLIMQSINYNPDRFKPVGMVSGSPYVLAIRPGLNIDSLQDLVKYAKANPGKLTHGSAGVGSSPQLGIELLKYTSNINLLHIPFKSGGEAVNAALGAQVDVVMDAIPVIMPHVKAGKLKALALASETASDAAPSVPSSTQAGNPDLKISSWNALFVPEGTPANVVNILNAALIKALGEPEFKQALEAQGSQVYKGDMAEYQSFIDAEKAKWKTIVKEAEIKVQ
ncbi:tripartite tricarboxylate transporter substrate binding protein [Pusillimonas sp. TS35]|nr:tripartite tricarboxylate transporter substrate binding protein [Pusillimonas sp. TS35]